MTLKEQLILAAHRLAVQYFGPNPSPEQERLLLDAVCDGAALAIKKAQEVHRATSPQG